MADMREYDSLINQKSDLQSQYSEYQNQIENCEYLLRRLRRTKESVSEQKQLYRKLIREHNDIVGDKHEWKGNTQTTFEKKLEDITDENERYYNSSLDRILDSINDEITRIENKKMEAYGILGDIGSWINDITNEIENFFN